MKTADRSGKQNEKAAAGAAPGVTGKIVKPNSTVQKVIDKSPHQTTQRKKATDIVQRKENKTGLPDNLKSGIENLSGMSMDSVKVHYNSSQPAQLNALAYAQGNDIHVASGQEKHLPHEAWHVVQQRQGRVKPTMQMKRGVPVNDDVKLEREADVMGAKALQMKPGRKSKGLEVIQDNAITGKTIQANGLKLLTSHNTDILNSDTLPPLNELVDKIEYSSGYDLDENDIVYLQRMFYHLSGGWETQLEEVLYGLSLKHGTDAGIPATQVTYGTLTTYTYNGVGRASSMVANPLTSNPGTNKGSDATNSKWTPFVEGHLLNHLLHGPAEYKNLAPFSTSLNRKHHDAVEDNLKKMVYNEGRYFYYKVEVTPSTASKLEEFTPTSIECTVIELDPSNMPNAKVGGYTQKVTLSNEKKSLEVEDDSFTDKSSAPQVSAVEFHPFDRSDESQVDMTDTWDSLSSPWTEEYGMQVWKVADAFYEGLTKHEEANDRSIAGKENRFFVPKTKVVFGPTTKAKVAEESTANIATSMLAFPLSLRPGNTFGYEPESDKWWSPYIKGHLLNHHLFGPASENNIIPMSKSLNTTFLNRVEQPLKEKVFEDGKVFSFKVTWVGESDTDPEGIFEMESDDFPKKLISEVQLYEPKSKNKKDLNKKSFMEDISNWQPKGDAKKVKLDNYYDE